MKCWQITDIRLEKAYFFMTNSVFVIAVGSDFSVKL